MQNITSTPKLSLQGTSLVQITDASSDLANVSVESLDVNIQRIAGAALAATNALGVQLSTGAAYYDARQIRALTATDVVTAAQGAAIALSGAWPVKVTDGTNTMPTADVAARAQFVKVTDGTNTQPTGDVVSRRIYTTVTDGTNTLPTGDVAARAIFTKTTDGTNTQAVEATPTFAAVGASYIHYLIQQGVYFLGQDYVTGLGNGATRDVLVITPAAKVVHARFSFSTLGGTYVLFEAPTTTANGTAITIRNRNRSSATTATTTMFFTPTVTATGTQLVAVPLQSTQKADTIFTTDDEIILAANTKYLIRFTSAAGSNISSTVINFYEV